MNIFVLDSDPQLAAKYHCDKHIVKMVTESLQMKASTLWYSLGITKKSQIDNSLWKNFPRELPYGIGYMNHPCTKWVRSSSQNWDWHSSLVSAMIDEHEKRWGRATSAKQKLEWFVQNKPTLPDIGLTPFILAMPDSLKTEDPVHSYRLFYAERKAYFATWKTSEPEWWKKYRTLTTQKQTT